MKDNNLEDLFKKLDGSFDLNEPPQGHRERFLEKLNHQNKVIPLQRTKSVIWRPLRIAASILVLVAAGLTLLLNRPSTEEQVASISPEVSQTQFYFASLIEEQIKELEDASTPDTQKLVEDSMVQLKKLETNYAKLEQDLIDGGNSKLILSAMITNFQTRIDLLQEVMNKIETIKNFKTYDNENLTI